MKRVFPRFAVAAALLAGATTALAGDLTGNAAVVSDYQVRGLTQTWGRPAVQGGLDYTAANGLAAGVWGSNVSDNSFPGGSTELDVYGSYGQPISGDWSWRAGLHSYFYPGADLGRAHPPLGSRRFNTLEANVALTWKWLTLTYNRALTDYFGADVEQGYRGSSRGTSYLQIDADLPLATHWDLALHAGHTFYTTSLALPLAGGATDPSYSDFGATLRWQFAPHWSASVGAIYATNSAFYGRTASFMDGSDLHALGGARAIVMVQATF